MHGIENAEVMSPRPRSLQELRQAIGDSWPPEDIGAASYMLAHAPRGGETYTAAHLGLK